MRRREFITLIGGAAAWPFAAHAQQPAMPVIGFLNASSPDAYRLRAFHQGLKEAGFVEGENVAVEHRWADSQIDRLPALAAELVRRQVAVIVAGVGVRSGLAAKMETKSIPVLFVAGEDPVKLGLVTSLAKPDANLTGVNILLNEVVAKRLELLRELLPKAIRVDVLADPANAETTKSVSKSLDIAARTMGIQIQVFNASTIREIDAAFAALVNERPDALFVGVSPFLLEWRVQLAQLAAHHSIPAIYQDREHVEVGGLMSYGASIGDAYRQLGVLPVVSSRALGLRTCQWCSRASLSWLSIIQPPGCSGSRCRRRCSASRTMLSSSAKFAAHNSENGTKRTSKYCPAMSAYDPKRTSGIGHAAIKKLTLRKVRVGY